MKISVPVMVSLLLVALSASARKPPPLYETNEGLPIDLAIERPRYVIKPQRKEIKRESVNEKKIQKEPVITGEETGRSANETTASKPAKAQSQKIPSKLVELPAFPKKLKSSALKPKMRAYFPPRPYLPLDPAKVLSIKEQAPREDLSIAPVAASSEEKQIGDAGTVSDAGDELLKAMPVTYTLYQENHLSHEDMVDIFKLYGRVGESIGIIIKPKDPNSLLAIDLIGETGNVLAETRASEPGETVAFQTSPLERNRIIYIQVRDIHLLVQGSAKRQLRSYSLELKPIPSASLPSLAAVDSSASPPQPEEKQPSVKEEE